MGMLVDDDGNYLLGGHTTGGEDVVNWDYLALKVNGKSQLAEWRKTFGQPRGFDPRYFTMKCMELLMMQQAITFFWVVVETNMHTVRQILRGGPVTFGFLICWWLTKRVMFSRREFMEAKMEIMLESI